MEAGEILNINNEYASYIDYKAAVDAELKKSAESFVRIGYLLKVARDTDILKESEYESVNDFAWKEYKLDRSQVSRFIRINDEFSEGGYSDVLQEKYIGIGYAKLAIMLTLPEVINEELSDGFSKSEIQTIKEEVDAEKAITDLEVMMEPKEPAHREKGLFEKVMYQLGHEQPEVYVKLYDVMNVTYSYPYEAYKDQLIKAVLDILAPAGEAIHSVRISGEGRKMLSLKGAEVNPVVIDVRSSEKESCTWNEFINSITYNQNGLAGAKESWEQIYGEPFPIKEEPKKAPVAPVQQNKPSKVTKAKVNSNAEKPKKPEKTTSGSESKVTDNMLSTQEKAECGNDVSPAPYDNVPPAPCEQSGTGDCADSSPERIPGESVSEENEGNGEATEQGSNGGDGREKEEISSLLRNADKVSGEVYDYCMDALEEPEDITLEELQGIKTKLSELSMIVEQLIALKEGEN